MAQPNEVINDATVTLLKEDFFVPAHQEIFAALRDMYNSAQAIDNDRDSPVAHRPQAGRGRRLARHPG